MLIQYRSILQVWFATGWSKETLKDFTEACNEVLKSIELLNKDEVKLVKHWLSIDVTLETAIKKWFDPFSALASFHLFQPCANFKHKIDRCDYLRYLLTGYVFEENEKKLIHGNR